MAEYRPQYATSSTVGDRARHHHSAGAADRVSQSVRFPTEVAEMARLVVALGFQRLAYDLHSGLGGTHIAMAILNRAREHLDALIAKNPPAKCWDRRR